MKSIKTSLIQFLAIFIALPIACTAFSCRHDKKEKPPIYKGKSSVFISYANGDENPNLVSSPTINVGFDGQSTYQPLIMDTGSCGITMSANLFTPAPDAVNLGIGITHYTDGTQNKELSGYYWTATQQIYDAKGNLQATAQVPVLQATTETDLNTGVSRPSVGFALMGIGFGREGYVPGGMNVDSPLKTPAYNAFLNLTAVRINGKLRGLPEDWTNGYIVSTKEAELGLTAKNTRRAGFIKLTPWPQFSTPYLSEWMPMSMTVCINDICCGNGMSVMDTGIPNAIINPPPCASNLENPVQNGVKFSVFYPNNKKPVACYNFTTGQTNNPMAPNSIAIQSRPTIYWNTSRHFLAGMNFIYDNTNGFAGFILHGNLSREDACVISTKSRRTRCHCN